MDRKIAVHQKWFRGALVEVFGLTPGQVCTLYPHVGVKYGRALPGCKNVAGRLSGTSSETRKVKSGSVGVFGSTPGQVQQKSEEKK